MVLRLLLAVTLVTTLGCSTKDPKPQPPPPEPAVWTCSETYFGTGDGCDCGCGIVDTDCAAGADVCTEPSCGAPDCEWCYDADGNEVSCAGPAPLAWTCDPSAWGDQVCDCGCGVADPECTGTACVEADCRADACEACHNGAGEATGCDYCYDASGQSITCP